MGLFSRRRKPAIDTDGLGVNLIALRLDQGDVAPAQSTVVIFNAGGHARRAGAGKVSCEQGETVFCFHPGPYTVDLIPFAAAPEWGLRLRFVVDSANPRVTQQRFDLYLYSEAAGRLLLDDFAAAAQTALQTELAQGALDLPPCTSVEEWHAFRAGLNQLMYTRYGVTVDDCVPVDLGEQIDFAEVLKARAAAEAIAHKAAEAVAHTAAQAAAAGAATAISAAATIPAAPSDFAAPTTDHSLPDLPVAAPAGPAGATPQAPQQDARGLRRLFIELPVLSSELRLLTLPGGLPVFQQHQSLLLRLGMAVLNVNTMPALAWAAPDQPLALEAQACRTNQTMIAVAAMDEAWSLLARLQLASHAQWPALLDEADRICANLETGLALRRATHAPEPGTGIERKEPSL
jgi:hypothetical protein